MSDLTEADLEDIEKMINEERVESRLSQGSHSHLEWALTDLFQDSQGNQDRQWLKPWWDI